MRGKRNETHSVRFLGHQRLEDYFANGKGTKKHIDKHKSPDVMKGKLYMDSTTNQYHKHWDDFCDSMKQADYTVNGHRPRTFEEAAGYMPAYIQELKSRPGARPGTSFSAWSVRVYFAAAAKVMGLSAADYALPTRHRRDITRSRDEAVRDKHFSVERNSELVNFCCCTGLRSRKELQQIRGTDLIDNGSGQYAIRVYGKGGRLRESVIYGTQEQIRQVVDRMKAAGEELVWPRVHSAADIHSYRAEYACRLYEARARDPKDLPPSERYCCRGDLKGQWFDRKAMLLASRELGHSRINVIAEHYLWRITK